MADPPQKLRRATTAPTTRTRVDGPGRLRSTKAGIPYRIDVFPGTHTSVALADITKGTIVSNNASVSSSSDHLMWLESTEGGSSRKIHFHVIGTRSTEEDTTLFLLNSDARGTRAVFQVRRVPFPPMNRAKKGRLFLTLNGLSISLNQADGKIDPYDLTENISVPNSMPHGTALDKALQVANGRMIDHLVINAHGRSVNGRAEIELGDHFHPGNLDSWDRLNGKVRYIWLQGCVIGFDNELLHAIAERTGAWVSAPANVEIESLPAKKLKIDYVPSIYKYFNASVPREGAESAAILPRDLAVFLRHARHEAKPNLKQSVAFLLDSPDS